MRIIRYLIAAIINISLGIILPALIISNFTDKEGLTTHQILGCNFGLDTIGIFILLAVIAGYYCINQYWLGITLGEKIANRLTGRK